MKPEDVELPEPAVMCDCGGNYYTADQVREAIEKAVAATVERTLAICKERRASRAESAARNDGRHSDFAFGYVNAADEIAAAIGNG